MSKHREYGQFLRRIAPRDQGKSEGVAAYMAMHEPPPRPRAPPPRCVACGQDPYEYVDNGVGMEPVAIVCCSFGVSFYSRCQPSPRVLRIAALLESADARKHRRGYRLAETMRF